MGDADLALLFKALSDSNRVKIVTMLSGHDERCACMLLEELGVTQPTLSHHMKVLCSSGLVDCRREGKWMHYSLDRDVLAKIDGFIGSL